MLLVAFSQTGYNVASIGTRITDPLSSFQFLTAAIVQLSQHVVFRDGRSMRRHLQQK